MMTSVQCVDTDLEEDPDSVKDLFLKFLTTVCSKFKETQEEEERVIMNNQTL